MVELAPARFGVSVNVVLAAAVVSSSAGYRFAGEEGFFLCSAASRTEGCSVSVTRCPAVDPFSNSASAKRNVRPNSSRCGLTSIELPTPLSLAKAAHGPVAPRRPQQIGGFGFARVRWAYKTKPELATRADPLG